MSMYNMVFGEQKQSDFLLSMIGLTREQCGRFRDAFVDGEEIAVYTRNGGGNREHYDDDTESGEQCDCTGCIMTYRLPQHTLYARDANDDFDYTYATIWFRLPDTLATEDREAVLKLGSGEPFNPSQRWVEVINALKEQAQCKS